MSTHIRSTKNATLLMVLVYILGLLDGLKERLDRLDSHVERDCGARITLR